MSMTGGRAPRSLAEMRKGPPGASRFAEAEHADDARGTMRALLRLLTRERGMLTALLLSTLAGTLCLIGAPAAQSRAVDIIAGEAGGDFGRTLAVMLALYLLAAAAHFLQGTCSARLSQRMVRRLRDDLFSAIVSLPVAYLDRHSHGDVMSRMTNDAETLSQTIAQSLPSIVSGVLTVVGTTAVMAAISWELTLPSLLTVLLTAAATRAIGRRVRAVSRRRQRLLGELNGGVEEFFTASRTVTAYGREEAVLAELSDTADRLTKEAVRAEVLGGAMGPVMNCIGNVGFVIIAAFGGYFAARGRITVGVISAFIVYAKQFGRPVNELAQLYGQIQSALAAAERVFRLLREPPEDGGGAALPEGADGQVRFSRVRFGYAPDEPVLKDFTLSVPKGKKVALVGATGSGKTTVVNLLERFYEPWSGTITVGGHDIADVSRSSLRRRMAIVLQDTVLFTGTVRENLRFADEAADDARLEAAARLSRCEKMIRALPSGWDTVLTGGGRELSQGERQLLAIARAFVADPDVLILDEATSSVDTRTEKAIQDAMQRVMRNRTSIVIAHRLSTIRDADLIVVLDHGEIVEQGTHEELLAAHGKYRELLETQIRGFAT